MQIIIASTWVTLGILVTHCVQLGVEYLHSRQAVRKYEYRKFRSEGVMRELCATLMLAQLEQA